MVNVIDQLKFNFSLTIRW